MAQHGVSKSGKLSPAVAVLKCHLPPGRMVCGDTEMAGQHTFILDFFREEQGFGILLNIDFHIQPGKILKYPVVMERIIFTGK